MQGNDLGIDRRIAHLVGLVGDDHVGLAAETIAQSLDLILASVIVLPEHRDLGIWKVVQNVSGVDASLALIVGLPAHGPWKVFGVPPFGCAGRHEELGYLLDVHVFVDRRIGWRSEGLKDQQHAVVFDEFARLLDRLGRTIGVVIGRELALAAVDAAFRVDLVEIGGFCLSDHGIGGGGPDVGHAVADFDFGIAGAGIVFLFGVGGIRAYGQQAKRSYGHKIAGVPPHRDLPLRSLF